MYKSMEDVLFDDTVDEINDLLEEQIYVVVKRDVNYIHYSTLLRLHDYYTSKGYFLSWYIKNDKYRIVLAVPDPMKPEVKEVKQVKRDVEKEAKKEMKKETPVLDMLKQEIENEKKKLKLEKPLHELIPRLTIHQRDQMDEEEYACMHGDHDPESEPAGWSLLTDDEKRQQLDKELDAYMTTPRSKK